MPRKSISPLVPSLLFLFALSACSCLHPAADPGPCAAGCGYEVVNVFPHDPAAFTQGLQFADGRLYESTGLEGSSSIRRVVLETGIVEQVRPLDAKIFGEGLTLVGDKAIQLTWRNQDVYVYDKNTFDLVATWHNSVEGWGLTYDGTRLIASDGSSTLYFRSPTDFSETGRMEVRDNNGLVRRLNELEFIDGLIYANVWQTDRIAIIDPATGKVRGYLNLAGLLPAADRTAETDVLNGIAYDAAAKRLFVTGKKWPKLFEIRPVEAR